MRDIPNFKDKADRFDCFLDAFDLTAQEINDLATEFAKSGNYARRIVVPRAMFLSKFGPLEFQFGDVPVGEVRLES